MRHGSLADRSEKEPLASWIIRNALSRHLAQRPSVEVRRMPGLHVNARFWAFPSMLSPTCASDMLVRPPQNPEGAPGSRGMRRQPTRLAIVRPT